MKRISKVVQIGNIKIGGNEKVAIQSMLNVPSYDIENHVKEAQRLKNAGCEILRIAIPDMDAIQLIPAIKEKVNIPLVADIHFDYRLAIESAMAGIDKIRINPGNIGDDSRVKQVVDICKSKNIPIRIGVNSGSVEKNILNKYGHPTAEALCESALYHVSLLEKFGFNNVVLSLKSSNVKTMVDANKFIGEKCNYPLHLGVTETGTKKLGIIKSAVGIGALLLDGIGDTIRVSLTSDPIEEIYAAKDILKAIGLEKNGAEIISCPTCGRTRIDIINLTEKIEKKIEKCHKNIKVAVMGCAVNGPGEAREADVGVAGGDGVGLIFKKGEIIRKVNEKNIVEELMKEIENL